MSRLGLQSCCKAPGYAYKILNVALLVSAIAKMGCTVPVRMLRQRTQNHFIEMKLYFPPDLLNMEMVLMIDWFRKIFYSEEVLDEFT